MFFSHRRILSLPVSPGSLSFQSSRKGTPTYSLFPHLFIVARGGAKPTLDLLGDSATIAFLADRGSRARWVCSVCTGSLLLGAAGLLRGYRAAVHWGAREALNQFGAEPSSERVCFDRNRLTGGGITTCVEFGNAIVVHWAVAY